MATGSETDGEQRQGVCKGGHCASANLQIHSDCSVKQSSQDISSIVQNKNRNASGKSEDSLRKDDNCGCVCVCVCVGWLVLRKQSTNI